MPRLHRRCATRRCGQRLISVLTYISGRLASSSGRDCGRRKDGVMDVGRMVGAVSRVVGTREIDGRPARVVVARRRYAGAIDEVWDALTNAERIPRWFLPVSGELAARRTLPVPGQRRRRDHARAIRRGCSPSPGRCGGQASWLTVRARAGRRRRPTSSSSTSRTSTTRSGISSGRRRRRRLGHGADGPGRAPHRNAGGRSGARRGVGRVRRTARRSRTACSESWADASIAAGTPADAARAAAGRTTAFYTGAPPPAGG